jgi:hypothetical protein
MKTEQVYKDRLLFLADKLHQLDILAPQRFDFNRWVGTDWKGKQDLSCGTQCCGFGLACSLPEFQALGLRLHVDMIGNEELGTPSFGFPTVSPVGTDLHASLSARETEHAADVIFGLNRDEFYFLFMPCENIVTISNMADQFGFSPLSDNATAQQLSEHIQRFVQECT